MSDSSRYKRLPLYEGQRALQTTVRMRANGQGYAGVPHATPKKKGQKQKFEEVLDLIYRRRWWVVVGFIFTVGAFGAYAYLNRTAPIYSSHSLVMVEYSMQTRSGRATGSNIFAEITRTLNDEILILNASSQLALRVAARIEKASASDPKNGYTILSTYQGKKPSTAVIAARLPGYVDFSIERDAGYVIRITAFSTNPREAAAIANAYSEEYALVTKEARGASLSGSQSYLQRQLADREAELRGLEAQRQSIISAGGDVRLDEGVTSLTSRIASLEAQRDDARLDLQQRRSTLRAIEEQISSIRPQLATRVASGLDRQIQNKQDEVDKLLENKAQIEEKYPQGNRSGIVTNELNGIDQKVEQLRSEISQLSQQLVNEGLNSGLPSGNEGISYVNDLRRQATQEQSAIKALEDRIQLIEERITREQRDLSRIPAQARQLAEVERQRIYAQQMYQFVTERLTELNITSEQIGSGYVTVIRQASIPSFPIPGGSRKIILFGVVVGLGVGFGLALLLDLVDNRLFKADQLRDLGYGVIGIIPNNRPLIKSEFKGKEYIERNGRKYATGLVAFLNPLSAVAEGYRQLRANIEFGLSRQIQVLVVTSPSVGEGKSLTAANLAITMAQSGRKTVLVDTDLRRPRVHEVFGLPMKPGLVHWLNANDHSRLEPYSSGIPLLDIIPIGEIVGDSSDMLGAESMSRFLSELRGQYECIILDTPPVRATADAILLSTRSDATLVVARAGHTKEGELEYCMEAMRAVGATVIGTLFNGFDVSMAYGMKYRYKQYSKYGQYSKGGYYTQNIKTDKMLNS